MVEILPQGPTIPDPDNLPRESRDARVNVTQVLYSGLGGHASVAFSLLGGDRSEKWASSLLFIGIEPLVAAYAQQSEKFNIPFESIRTKPGKPWRAWASTYASLRRLVPDVVILHSISSLPPVAFYCLMHGVRVIAVEHTPIALKSRAERIASALAHILVKRVIVLTDEYRCTYLSLFRLIKRPHKVVVIPNGIDVAAFSRLTPPAENGVFRIGMAARFTSAKRQDLLVGALAVLAQRRSDVHWHITLAGDGDCLEAVRNLADASGLGDRVTFMGQLDEQGLIEWFRSLDLYAHASEGEALSTSMLQAMSMALAMVASAVPGITDLLDNGNAQLGVLVANTDKAFADGIEILYFNPDLRARLGASCRARALSAYSQESMFQSYDNLVQEALK